MTRDLIYRAVDHAILHMNGDLDPIGFNTGI